MYRILIIGAGGTGGYFGARLLEVGADVTFLARGKRLANLKEKGLRIESRYGNFDAPVKTVSSDEPIDGFDIVVVTVKAYHLDEHFLEALRKTDNGRNYVVPFLNGMRHMSVLESVYGRLRTLGGLCRISVVLQADGVIRHLNPAHEFMVGGRDDATKREAERLLQAAKGAKLVTRQMASVEQCMWEKWYALATLTASTCLMRAPIGCISRCIEGRSFMERLYREAASVAAAYGFPPNPDLYREALKEFTDLELPLTASVLRDLESGANVEADHIIGDLYRRGCAAGLHLPLLSLANLHLEAALERRARGL